MNFLNGKWIVIAIAAFALTAGAYAQSPRDQLQQLTAQLQKDPDNNALRVRIIKLAAELKPAPAIPEEAREPFVMGATVLKKAGDPAGARKAIDLFTQALNIAPWFADAYYNRAIASETAGLFERAMDDLKLFLEFKLTDGERRQAQDKIYALKADAQLAAAKAAADTPQAREAALLQKVEGARFVSRRNGKDHRGEIRSEEDYQIRNGTLVFTYKLLFYSMKLGFCEYGKCQPGEYVLARGAYRNGAFHLDFGDFTRLFRIRPDGQALVSDGGFYNSKPNDQTHSNRGEVVLRE